MPERIIKAPIVLLGLQTMKGNLHLKAVNEDIIILEFKGVF